MEALEERKKEGKKEGCVLSNDDLYENKRCFVSEGELTNMTTSTKTHMVVLIAQVHKAPSRGLDSISILLFFI